MPALLKILVVFSTMLLATRLGLPLGLALIAGGLSVDLWAGASASALGVDLVHALQRPELWLLLLITVLILEFGRHMASEKNAETLLAAARRIGGRHGRAFSVMAIPAVIGLIPMPGGALVSAPLVDRAVAQGPQPSSWRAGVNYWFRHVWEYWWPLYPVVIVSLPIFDMETSAFMATTFLFSPVAMLSGYYFLVRPHLSALSEAAPGGESSGAGRAGLLLLPVLVILLATLLLPYALRLAWPEMDLAVRKMLAMLVAVAMGLGMITFRVRGPRLRSFLVSLFTRKSMNILSTLGGVLVFQSLLNESGLLPAAGRGFVASGAPWPVVVALLPLVAGLVTGLAVGFAGTSFPLVVGLLTTEGSGMTPMSTLALAFSFGYAGMMLSPVHLCFVLTRGYFSTTFARVYREVLPCVLVLMLAGVLLSALFLYLGW